jgi:hypothetical protein
MPYKTYQARKAAALRGFKRSNDKYQIHVDKLRRHLFPKGIIPLDCEDSWNHVTVPMAKGGHMRMNVICVKSKSDGSDNRGMQGMRLYVICPECGTKVSAGRLHQHYGYKHS